MPINHFDLQRLAAIKIKEDIRKKGSPSRFGKDSSENASSEDKMAKSLVGRLIKQRVEPK